MFEKVKNREVLKSECWNFKSSMKNSLCKLKVALGHMEKTIAFKTECWNEAQNVQGSYEKDDGKSESWIIDVVSWKELNNLVIAS